MLLNQPRANELMAQHDLKALVATSVTNVGYFTGFDCWQYASFRENMLQPGAPESLLQSYGILPLDGSPHLVTSIYSTPFPVEDGVLVRGYGGAPDVIPPKRRDESRYVTLLRERLKEQTFLPGEALVAVLKEVGSTSGRVGVDAGTLIPEARRALKRALPKVELLDATHLIRFIRMVKIEAEVKRMRRSAEIAESALVTSLSKAHVGATAGEVRQTYMTEVARGGALFEHWAYSPHGFGQTDEEGYRFGKNEYRAIDVGCIYKRYYADTGTTLDIGEGRDDVRKTYDSLWNVVEECKDVLRPGETCSSILARFAKAYERVGLRDVDYQGHGIGLETREHPIIKPSKYNTISDDVVNRDKEIPLEKGMVINIETPLHIVPEGDYQVERTFLIGGGRTVSEITPKREPGPFITG